MTCTELLSATTEADACLLYNVPNEYPGLHISRANCVSLALELTLDLSQVIQSPSTRQKETSIRAECNTNVGK